MKNIYIVAQEFQTPGNCGALARSMENFGCKSLIFLNPKCDYLSKESMDRATHAKEILKKAKVMKSLDEVKKKFDYVVGTTARIGTDYNISRAPLSPEQFAKILTKKKYAIIIGREDHGLSNEEVKQCDFTVTIPTSPKFQALNVSHAATIILYELFKASNEEKVGSKIQFASGKDKEVLNKIINESIDRMDFNDDYKRDTQKYVWKRVVGKSQLTRREVFALCGFFKKAK